MKRKITSLVLASMVITSMAQQKFHLTGHLDNVPSDSVVLMVLNEDNHTEVTDSIALHNGDIDYSVDCHNSLRIMFVAPKEGNLTQSFNQGYMIIPAYPGQKCVLKGSVDNYIFSGDSFYRDFNAWDEISSPIDAKMNDLQDEFMKRVEAGEDRETVGEELNKKYSELQSELNEATKKFIRNNPSSQVSGYLLPKVPTEAREELKALLSEDVIQGPTAPWIKSVEKQEMARAARTKNAKSIQPGLVAPDFSLPDLKGTPLALSSLRGKYVVLDFWGSWCGWCIKGMPEMKKYYEKYKNKMEIVGVDCNDTEDRWKAAVEKNQLPWLHVRCDNESNVTFLYAIEGYPTKIVIDPEGKIAKVIVGEDPTFYSYLDELLK